MPIGNKVFYDVSETLLEVCRNERCAEVSSIWWVQTHEKSANKIGGIWRSFDEEECRSLV